MGRFLRVTPQPHRSITQEEQIQVLRAFKRLWPQHQINWTVDEAGLLASGGQPLSGRPSEQCCQMLFTGHVPSPVRERERRLITDWEAMRLLGDELAILFPGVSISYPSPS